jgi:heme exporter protein C
MREATEKGAVLAAAALVLLALGVVLFLTPAERSMGEVQKIFYFHVGSAAAAFLAFTLVAAFSLAYLVRRGGAHDAAALACAEIGVLFCTLVLVTGPLWARPIWGRWWVWEPKLTTTLILWFLYVGYLVLRHAVHGHRGTVAAAVYGIVAFADVPVVYFANRWWRGEHPVVFAGGAESGIASRMVFPLVLSIIAMLALAAVLGAQRFRTARLAQRVERLEHEMGEDEA